MSIVIAVSGKINTGKTTISKLIASEFQFSYVSFGDYVRKLAKDQHLGQDRETLQNLGQQLFENDVYQFCNDVLFSTGWNGKSSLVIDGIRHLDVYESLKKLVNPLPVYLIYVFADEEIRQVRTIAANIITLDSHPSESDVKAKLLEQADIVVDNTKSLDVNRNKIFNWIRSIQKA